MKYIYGATDYFHQAMSWCVNSAIRPFLFKTGAFPKAPFHYTSLVELPLEITHFCTEAANFGWYKTAEEGQPTIVFFHGNKGNIATHTFQALS